MGRLRVRGHSSSLRASASTTRATIAGLCRSSMVMASRLARRPSITLRMQGSMTFLTSVEEASIYEGSQLPFARIGHFPFLSRTPGPSLSSSTKITPAASSALIRPLRFARLGFRLQLSKPAIIERATLDRSARSFCDQLIRPRAARSCAGVMVVFVFI